MASVPWGRAGARLVGSGAALLRALALGRLSLLLFALAAAVSTYVHVGRLTKQATLENYLRDLSYNDTFYYYQVARNFARGLFSTYDGVSLTNGYHPLWAWLLTPAFWLEPRPEQVLPYLKSIELALLALAVVALAATFHALRASPWLAWPALGAALIDPHLTSGMETAVSCLMLVLSALSVVRALREPQSRATWIVCALALGVLPYARLELVVVSALVPVGIWLYCGRSGLAPRLGLRVFAAVVAGLVGLYFAFSRVVFGSATPVSGELKRYWSQREWAASGGFSFWDNFSATLALDWQQERLVLAAAAIALALAPWLLRRYRARAYAAQHGLDFFLLSLAASQVGQLLYGAVATLPKHGGTPWYFASTRLFDAAFLPLLLCRGYCLGQPFVAKPAMVLFAGLLVAQAADRSDWYFTRLKYCQGVDWETADYAAAQWVNQHLPASAVLGSADSGIYSFFTDRRVINVDGLVNSPRYADLQQQQQLRAWLDDESGIEYYANAAKPEHLRDSCTALQLGMRQNAALTGQCTLLYTGLEFEGRKAAVWRYERP